MRPCALRAQLLEQARLTGEGRSFYVRLGTEIPDDRHSNTDQLVDQIRAALKGWALFLHLDTVTPNGSIVISVLKVPPDLH